MSTDRRRARLVVAALAASVLLLSPVQGTQAAFVGSTTNVSTLTAHPDWTPPTTFALEAWKTEGGTPGFVRSPGGYRMLARVVDQGNPPSGVASVTSTNGPSTLVANPLTLQGVDYTHLGQLIPIAAGRAAATLLIYNDATDVAGNVAATYGHDVVLENTAPAGNLVDVTNGPGTLGRPDTGDVVRVRWGEIVEPHVMVPTTPATTPPSGWTGAAGTAVTVRITNGTNDLLTVWNAAGTAQLPFGSINLGGNGYVSATTNFTGSTVTWTDTGQGFTIVLGTQAAGGAVATVAANQTAVWTPAAGAIDRAGNPSTTANVNETGTADRNL